MVIISLYFIAHVCVKLLTHTDTPAGSLIVNLYYALAGVPAVSPAKGTWRMMDAIVDLVLWLVLLRTSKCSRACCLSHTVRLLLLPCYGCSEYIKTRQNN